MFTCKQVSNALSKEDYEKLHPFNKQVMESQDMCRCYKKHEEELVSERPKLEDGKKEELKQLLVAQSQENTH